MKREHRIMSWFLSGALALVLACGGVGPSPRVIPEQSSQEPGSPEASNQEVATSQVASKSDSRPVEAVAAPDSREMDTEAGVRVTLLLLNDVYEIGPVEGGQRGGLARVATLGASLREDNPNTLVVHAGDMVSPSAMGTAKVDGERLAGRQMVAVLNRVGLDLATFGNHEFDLDEAGLRRRLEESEFSWTSANVFDAAGEPFPAVTRSKIYRFEGADGTTARVGFIGVTLEEQGQDYLLLKDPLAALRREAEILRPRVDVLVALTHLRLEQDATVAEEVQELDLILGGHEHENYDLRRGPRDTPILKGDANARSVYVVDLRVLPREGGRRPLKISYRFVPVDASIPQEPTVAEEVGSWTERAFAGFRATGFEPEEVVTTSPTALEGRETIVRNESSALTDLIASAMLRDVPEAELAFYNSGSIRIDDVLAPGPISQYDVIRVLPFGGPVMGLRIKGSLLTKVVRPGDRLGLVGLEANPISPLGRRH